MPVSLVGKKKHCTDGYGNFRFCMIVRFQKMFSSDSVLRESLESLESESVRVCALSKQLWCLVALRLTDTLPPALALVSLVEAWYHQKSAVQTETWGRHGVAISSMSAASRYVIRTAE